MITGEKSKERVDTSSSEEKQLKFLLRLSDALRPLENPVDIEEVATKIAMDFMDADRCYYNNLENGNAIVLRDAWRGNLSSLAGVYPLSSFPLFQAVVDKGRPFIVDDVNTSNILEGGLRQVCLQLQVISFINVPVIQNSEPVGVLSLVQSKPRKWTDAEVQISIETAERIGAAIERAKVEEELRKSEEKYRTLFTSIDQGFTLCEIIRNKEGKGIDFYMLEVNPTYEKQTGVSRETVLGKKILETFPSLKKWIETYASVVDNQCPVVFEHYFEDTDRWFAIKAYPVEKERFAVLFSNITERKQAEKIIKESENRFRNMADASPVLIWTIGADGLSSYYNKPFRDFIGVPKDEDISDWRRIVHPTDIKSTFETINCAITERSSYSLECRLLRADGQWRWVLAQGNPIMGADKDFLGFVGSAVDITERMEAESKIKESEQKFEAAVLAVKGIIWTNSADGKMIGEQPGWSKLTGQHFEEYQGYGWVKAVHPDDALPTLEAWNKAVANQTTFEFEHRVHTKESGWKLFSIKAVPFFNENNVVQQWVGVHTDITEQREAAQKIQESENRFRNLVRDTTTAIAVLTGPEMKVEIVNDAYGNLIERTLDELMNKPLFSIVPEAEAYYRPILDKVYLTGEAITLYDSPFALKGDGKTIEGFLHIVYQPYCDKEGNILGVMVICQDVTESINAKKALQESEAKFRSVVADAPVVIGLFVGRDLVIENPNQAFIDVVGKGWGIVGKPLREAMPELVTENQPYLQILDDVYTSGKPFRTAGSLVKIVQNGVMTHRYYNFTYSPLFDTDGKVWALLDIAIDVTEQIEATQKAQESEERFRLLSDEMPQFVWTGDAKGNLNYFNEAVYEYSGLIEQQIFNDRWIQIVHPADREENIRLWQQSIATGKDFIFEHRFKRADGEYRWQLSRAVPQRDTQGVIQQWIGTSTDIHDQKNVEEQLEKLVAERTKELQRSNEDLQQFAHVASHDLKEPIRKIETFTNRLEQHLSGMLDETGTHFIERIHVATDRMFNMIDGVLTYSMTNASPESPQKVDLTQVVKSIETDLDVALQKKGAILFYNNLPVVDGASVLLYQLFYNLINNSIKFARANVPPRVTISSEAFIEDNKSFVCITLQDNGIGFEPDQAGQIFKAFFRLNSKDKYEGTGLGLSLCKKIVDRHGGRITASGTPDEGATFTIILPVEQNKISF